MKEGRKPEYPEKTPDHELQKMPHTKARRFKPQATLEPVVEIGFIKALLYWRKPLTDEGGEETGVPGENP